MNFILILLLVWAVAVGGWMMLSRVNQTADMDKIKQRLTGAGKAGERKKGKTKDGHVSLIRGEDTSTGKVISRLLKKWELQPKLQTLLEQAGLKWKVGRLIHSSLGIYLLSFWLLNTMIPGNYKPWAFLIAAAPGTFPLLFVLRKRGQRLHKFEEQFPESLEFVARSMRAGHAFSVSLEMIFREFQEPLAGEFKRTFEEHNLGLPLDTALEKLAKRVPLLDVQFFVSAVMLQKRTGGNLAEILDKLAYVIRERFKLRGKIRAISAHGRMTGTALTCIPLVVALMMFWVNPEYIRFFFVDEIGNYMMGAAIVLQLLGYAIIQKIVSIEV